MPLTFRRLTTTGMTGGHWSGTDEGGSFSQVTTPNGRIATSALSGQQDVIHFDEITFEIPDKSAVRDGSVSARCSAGFPIRSTEQAGRVNLITDCGGGREELMW